MIAQPRCNVTYSGYPHPGCAEFGPPDEWGCDSPARLVCSHPDDPDAVWLACVHCALTNGFVILRAITGVDVGVFSLATIDACLLDIPPSELDAYAWGFDPVEAPEDDLVYQSGWDAIIELRTSWAREASDA